MTRPTHLPSRCIHTVTIVCISLSVKRRQSTRIRNCRQSALAPIRAGPIRNGPVSVIKAAFVAALNSNQKTRAHVLREIVDLQSVTDKFFVRAFVAMQYFGYLRRDPDTIGYNNWVTTLTARPE